MIAALALGFALFVNADQALARYRDFAAKHPVFQAKITYRTKSQHIVDGDIWVNRPKVVGFQIGKGDRVYKYWQDPEHMVDWFSPDKVYDDVAFARYPIMPEPRITNLPAGVQPGSAFLDDLSKGYDVPVGFKLVKSDSEGDTLRSELLGGRDIELLVKIAKSDGRILSVGRDHEPYVTIDFSNYLFDTSEVKNLVIPDDPVGYMPYELPFPLLGKEVRQRMPKLAFKSGGDNIFGNAGAILVFTNQDWEAKKAFAQFLARLEKGGAKVGYKTVKIADGVGGVPSGALQIGDAKQLRTLLRGSSPIIYAVDRNGAIRWMQQGFNSKVGKLAAREFIHQLVDQDTGKSILVDKKGKKIN